MADITANFAGGKNIEKRVKPSFFIEFMLKI
jgi:hypothetical protein